MKRKMLCLALAFIISVFTFGTFAYANSDTFIYEHDPRDNPEAMKDIIEDPDAVYGFSPDPESERLGSYAEYDWSDPELVKQAQEERRAYHESMDSMTDILYEMREDGASMEEMARAVSEERNRLRLEACEDDPEAMAALKESNLKTYGHEEGPTPDELYEKYGSWTTVLQKAFSPNMGMDACCGLYDEYYRLYIELGYVEDTEAEEEDPYRLVDIYCSQSAKDALGDDQLQTLVDLIVTSIEPQAVNLLVESFPCFTDAAVNEELGREIGLYIYYGAGDQDGISEHEDVAPGAYAYVLGGADLEEGESVFEYLICMDAETLSTVDDMNNAVLDMDEQTRIQVDTTFCHELFHAFMDDYNRVGMSGYTDFDSYMYSPDEVITVEEGDRLIEEVRFPNWFMEGLAGCVGNIYPADLQLFQEYHYDIDTQQYLDTCTDDQLRRMYANMGYMEGTGTDLYDMEAFSEDNSDGHVNGATYVSGYMACLYLADLACRESEGSGAVTFDQNGDIESVSSEKLREGLSEILSRLHQGETLDEVISKISGGAYENTDDFTKRFIKGVYNEETQDYDGDPESLAFCVGYLNYMNRLDAMDPETHPVGSVLMDDFGSTQPTPLEKDAPAASDFYKIIEENTMTVSTVSNENIQDGGTSYSGRDSFETVVEMFKAAG